MPAGQHAWTCTDSRHVVCPCAHDGRKRKLAECISAGRQQHACQIGVVYALNEKGTGVLIVAAMHVKKVDVYVIKQTYRVCQRSAAVRKTTLHAVT